MSEFFEEEREKREEKLTFSLNPFIPRITMSNLPSASRSAFPEVPLVPDPTPAANPSLSSTRNRSVTVKNLEKRKGGKVSSDRDASKKKKT